MIDITAGTTTSNKIDSPTQEDEFSTPGKCRSVIFCTLMLNVFCNTYKFLLRSFNKSATVMLHILQNKMCSLISNFVNNNILVIE